MSDLYKINVLWTAWTPQIATRIVRDMLAIQRLARVNRTTLLVAADAELHPKLVAIGVVPSSNFEAPAEVRIYVDRGNFIPDEVGERVPEDCAHVNVVYLGNGEPEAPNLSVDDGDPYAGVQFYKSWRYIPDTMPKNQKAPPPNGEPMISPFL